MPPRGRRGAGAALSGGAGGAAAPGAAHPPPPESLLNLLLLAAPRVTPGESHESRASHALSVPSLAAVARDASGLGARAPLPPLRAVAQAVAAVAERYEVEGEARYLIKGAWSAAMLTA